MEKMEGILREHPWTATLTLSGREIATAILDTSRWPERMIPSTDMDRVVNYMFKAFLLYRDGQERAKTFRFGRAKSYVQVFDSYSLEPESYQSKHPNSYYELLKLNLKFRAEIDVMRRDMQVRKVTDQLKTGVPAETSGSVYIVAHGGYQKGNRTFVPRGMTVHLFTDVDTALVRSLGLQAIAGQVSPWRSVTSPSSGDVASVENLTLVYEDDTDEKAAQYLASLSSQSPEGDIYILGLTGAQGDWPNVRELSFRGSGSRLCTGSCYSDSKVRKSGHHTCDGYLKIFDGVQDLFILACTSAADTGFRRWLKENAPWLYKGEEKKPTAHSKKEQDRIDASAKARKQKEKAFSDLAKTLSAKYNIPIPKLPDGSKDYAGFAKSLQELGVARLTSNSGRDREKAMAIFADVKKLTQVAAKRREAIREALDSVASPVHLQGDVEMSRVQNLLADGDFDGAISYVESLPQATQAFLAGSITQTEAMSQAWAKVRAGTYLKAHIGELRADPMTDAWQAWRKPVWRKAFWEWMNGVGIEQGIVFGENAQRLRMFELLDTWVRMKDGEGRVAGEDLKQFAQTVSVTGAVNDILGYGESIGWDMSQYEIMDANIGRLRDALYWAQRYEANDRDSYETDMMLYDTELSIFNDSVEEGRNVQPPNSVALPESLRNARLILLSVEGVDQLFPEFSAIGLLPEAEEISVVLDAAQKEFDESIEYLCALTAGQLQEDFEAFLAYVQTLPQGA